MTWKNKLIGKGVGRPKKGYVRMVLRAPKGAKDALRARRQGSETPGEALARLLGIPEKSKKLDHLSKSLPK